VLALVQELALARVLAKMSEVEILRKRALAFPMFPVSGSSQEQEAFIEKVVKSILKVRKLQSDLDEKKKLNSTKKISGMVQEFVPKMIVKCQAINMNNTPCKFKATCGKFCKKHQVSKKDLDEL
jgi:hypothetical protein